MLFVEFLYTYNRIIENLNKNKYFQKKNNSFC